MDYFQQLLIACPLVFLAGFVDSIAGGGGLISLPAYYIAGLPPHLALATNKFSSAIGTVVSTSRFVKNRSFDLGAAVPSILLAFIGSALGARMALLLDERVLQMILVFCIPPVAAFILWKKDLHPRKQSKDYSRRKVLILASLISFVIGAYDGFFGPGTGTFLIIAYTVIIGFDLLTSMGNTKLVNLTSNVASLIVFILDGKVLFSVGIPCAVCAIAGHYIGSGIAIKNSKKIVRPMLVAVLVLLLAKLVWDLIPQSLKDSFFHLF